MSSTDIMNRVLPRIAATAYLTPLREGGSLPALVEADDYGTYVVKFTGAGQGPKALVAEIVVGELGRALGIPVPDLALIDVDARSAGGSRTRRSRTCSTASAGLTSPSTSCPARSATTAARRPTPEAAADRLAGRVHGQRRPQRSEHQPADLAPEPLGDRPRRLPAFPPRLGGGRELRHLAVRLRRSCARRSGQRAQRARAARAQVTDDLLPRCSPSYPTSGWSPIRNGPTSGVR